MAADTIHKRFFFLEMMPPPSGGIDAVDRRLFLGLFPFFLISTATVAMTIRTTIARAVRFTVER